jgi:hypothetical protein
MADGFITFAQAGINFLLGPSTDPTTDTENASVIRLSANARTDALTRAAAAIALDAPNPWAVSARKTGTVAWSGGATITGTGTSFLTDLVADKEIVLEIPAINDPLGEGFMYHVLPGAPTTNTSVPINAFYSPFFTGSVGSVSGANYRVEVDTINGSGFNALIEQLMYYDFGYALYQSAYKHAAHADGATLMSNADAVAKLWWEHPINQTARRAAQFGNPGDLWPGSRHAALGTLLVWALRDCPGASAGTATNVFDYCLDVADAAHAQWNTGREAYTGIASDVRDPGYAIHWQTMLSVVHPVEATRDACRAKALVGSLDYLVRLQNADGTFRALNTAWWNFTTDTDNYPAAQPFLSGLLLNALVDLHRSLREDPAYAAEAAEILAAIKLGVDGQIKSYGGAPNHAGYSAVTGAGTAPLRALTYAIGGPDFGYTAVTPCELIPGDTDRWYDPKATTEASVAGGTSLADAIASARFLNSTVVHAPYYAAIYSSGATRTAYLAFGDELLASQWEYTDGDGFRSQWYVPSPKNKDWDEHMRAQMRGLAWRKLAVAGATTDDPEDLVLASLAIIVQPSGAVSGRPLAVQPVIHVLDDEGNLDTTYDGAVLATVDTGVSTIPVGGIVSAVGGVGTFRFLTLEGEEDMAILQFSAEP